MISPHHEFTDSSSAPEPSGMVTQPIRKNQFYKILHKKLRMPLWMIQPFHGALRIAGSPLQHRLRKRLAKEIRTSAKSCFTIPEKEGHRLFRAEDIHSINGIVRHCQVIYQEARQTFPREHFQKHPHKNFLFPILEGIEFCRHPELLRLMVSRPIVDAAAAYLGAVPELTGARLCWSPENLTAQSSQLFHFDYEDTRQIKVFINIFETREDQGPLTFLPADVSTQVQKTIGRVLGRVRDERIYSGGGRGHEIKVMGPSGSGVFLDTSRCLHYGSRYNRRDRVVLIFQFLRWHSSYQSTAPFQVPKDFLGPAPDPIQKLVLGLE